MPPETVARTSQSFAYAPDGAPSYELLVCDCDNVSQLFGYWCSCNSKLTRCVRAYRCEAAKLRKVHCPSTPSSSFFGDKRAADIDAVPTMTESCIQHFNTAIWDTPRTNTCPMTASRSSAEAKRSLEGVLPDVLQEKPRTNPTFCLAIL